MSFKEILQDKEDDKDPLDPLEQLEILSDTEEACEDEVLPDWLKEDEYVSVGGNKNGTVRYIGPADFAPGVWVGVELDMPAGTSSLTHDLPSPNPLTVPWANDVCSPPPPSGLNVRLDLSALGLTYF